MITAGIMHTFKQENCEEVEMKFVDTFAAALDHFASSSNNVTVECDVP